MPLGRVRTRSAFRTLRQHGRRARSGALVVTFTPPESASPTRPCVAFAIGRQVGTAVVRNRVRRRLRAAARELAPPAGNYLVSTNPSAAGASYAELRDDLARALDLLTTAGGARP